MKEQIKKSPKFSIKYLFHDIVKIIAGIPGLIWHRPKRIYENENAKKRIKSGALLISNHLGFFDPIYVMYAIWYRRIRFVCLEEFFQKKSKLLFKLFLCIPINKQNPSIRSVREIVTHLKQDETVSIFPEGAVNDGSGNISQFKSGVILMATQSKKPIVPLYVKPKTHWYERIKIVMGEPIIIDDKNITFQAMDRIAKDLENKEKYLSTLV